MLSFNHKRAGVSELADETDSKSVVREGVWVRVPPPALETGIPYRRNSRFSFCFIGSLCIEIVCKGVDKSRIDRDFPLAF